ncbi:MAG: hypothetical protein ACRDGI_11355, partial [Candidatus Limnocylindrales bacterium]
MRPVIWIPAEATAAERQRLAELADVQVYPPSGPTAERIGRGDLIVGGSHPRRALELAAHIGGLRYFQTFSAGVDRIVGNLPDGVI